MCELTHTGPLTETKNRVNRLRMSLRVIGAYLVLVTVQQSTWADVTIPIAGIGTHVGAIDTHVDSVTYSNPLLVAVDQVGQAYEIRGQVQGIGWGGAGIVTRAANAHYRYSLPFVARWRAKQPTKDLLVHHHGGNPTLIAVLQLDRLVGVGNGHRTIEYSCDRYAGVPSLLNSSAYVCVNRRGLNANGNVTATYLTSEVPTLTQAEVDSLRSIIAPGDQTYQHQALYAGAPVPLAPTFDTATFRDASRAIEHILTKLIVRKFRTRFCAGQSSGSILAASINFGVSPMASASVRTGGNQVIPYDSSSPRIFDAFLLSGFVYNSSVERADTQFPISAPVFFIQSRADERYQQPIRMADELLRKGVDLNSWLRIYEVKGIPHLTRDFRQAIAPSDADPLGPFWSAAIRNLGELIRDSLPPPVSRIAGRVVNGGLVFDEEDGGTTNQMPVAEDPRIDSVTPGPELTIRTVDQPVIGETPRWLAITAALDHIPDAIEPPMIACRVGGYRVGFFSTQLIPFSPATLTAMYGGFDGYLACVEDTIAALEAERLYDPRVESGTELAIRARSLFGP
jgi:hypothetical protein